MTTRTYKIAHIRKQGQDIIIVPLESQFHYRSQTEKESFRDAIQQCATKGGLKGIVCLVWNDGNRFYFIAPAPGHPFFKSLNMTFVASNINRKITCDFG